MQAGAKKVHLHISARRCIQYCVNLKGGIILPATGYIQVHAYSSYAQIPLQNVAVTVSASDGTALAVRLTDRSGRISPIPLPVPQPEESQTPGSPQAPYATFTLQARLQGYEQIRVEGLQVFADTVTAQNLEMVPLSELPGSWAQSENFPTPPQNL